ncbi:MAG: methionyl-tRNA formyltransferase [Chitinophagales bacterium]
MKIVFMGTPDFAVPSLDILLQNGYDIVGVITATDKRAGRGNKLQQSAVKKYALEKGLNVLQPKNLKNADFQAELAALKAELQVVVAFRMLPATVFEMPPKGTINLHGSLLPQYRGAAPINWAVINGDTESGVTTFFIEQKIDTGEMIFQAKVPIAETDTAGNLHDNLQAVGAELLLKTVNAIRDGDYPRTKQVLEGESKKAPKIFKETCKINWEQPTASVYNFIRGMSPYPTAFTHLDGKSLKVFSSEKIIEAHDYKVGTWLSDGKKFLRVATLDGFVELKEIQLQGKKRMMADAFLRGYKLSDEVVILS